MRILSKRAQYPNTNWRDREGRLMLIEIYDFELQQGSMSL
jgi:hypothetical protein